MGCLILFGFGDLEGQNQNLVCTTVDGDIGTLTEICFGTTLVQPEELFISEVGVEFTLSIPQSPSQKYGTGFEITAKAGVVYNNYHVAFYRACDTYIGNGEISKFFQVHSESLNFSIPNEQYGYGTAWIPINYPTNINESNDSVYGDSTPCDSQLGEGNYKFYAIAIYHKENGIDILDDFFSIGTGAPGQTFYEYGSTVPLVAEDGVVICHYPSNIGANFSTPQNSNTHFQFGDGGWVYGDYSSSGILKSPGSLNPNLTDLSLTPYYALRHEFSSASNLPAIHTVPSIRGRRIGPSDANNASFNFPIDFVNKNNSWGDTENEINDMYRWANGVTSSNLKRHRDNVLKGHFLSIKTLEYFKNIHDYILASDFSDCAYNDVLYMIYTGQTDVFSNLGSGQYKLSVMSCDFNSPSIAHEWGHMNALSFSNSNYFGLSEAYPDIWGTLADRYAFNRTQPTYTGVRNLSTYFNIYSSAAMNQYGRDPHEAGRPFAHWFYLLAEGGSGQRTVNLPGRCEPYEFTVNVNGIGYNFAERIVFEMMDNIAANNSINAVFPDDLFFFDLTGEEKIADFLDFKVASEQALDELVADGTISQAQKPSFLNSIQEAWAAIGVAEDFYPDECIRITCDYTWEHTKMRIDKPIYVAPGGHLRFPSSSEEYEIFGTNGAIIVEPGGKLTIEGTLSRGTAVSRWKGVTVLGNNSNIYPFVDDNGIFLDSNDDPVDYPISPQDHGTVLMRSDGKIEYSEIAIEAPNTFVYENDCTHNGETIESKGGLVVVTKGRFVGNIQDVSMNNVNADGSWGGDNPSMFKNTWVSRSLLGTSMSFTGFASLRFTNNNMDGKITSEGEGLGIGISLFDSQIYAHSNTFDNWNQAIYKNNLSGNFNCLCGFITESIFDNNTLTNVKQGLTIVGGGLDMFLNNKFNTIPQGDENTINNTFYDKDSYGIYTAIHSGFEMYNNQFNGFPSLRPFATDGAGSYGIIVYESEDWTNTATENKFEGLDYGISTQGFNPFLQINCNLFANDGRPHNATAWAVVDGVLPTQGINCDDPTTPAGNEWGHLGADCATDVAKYDMILGQQVESFKYFAHQNSTNHRTTPDEAICVENPPIIDIEGCIFIKDEDSCEGGLSVQSPIGKPDAILVTDIQGIDTELAILENDLINKETEKNNTSNPIALKQIEEEIQTLKTKIYRLENTKIRFLGILGDAVGIEQTLDNSHSSAAKKRLIQLYLAQGLYQKSRTELINMQQYISSHHSSDYNLYVQLMTIVIDAVEQQRTYTSTELADLQTIANTGTSAASIQANAILYRLNGEIYHPPIRKIGTSSSKRSVETTTKSLIRVYPNPAKDNITIQNNDNEGNMFIFNNVGKLIKALVIESKSSTTSIDVSNWSNGLYFYQFVSLDSQIENGKLMIQH